jgi:hypothetical protein
MGRLLQQHAVSDESHAAPAVDWHGWVADAEGGLMWGIGPVPGMEGVYVYVMQVVGGKAITQVVAKCVDAQSAEALLRVVDMTIEVVDVDGVPDDAVRH